MAEVNPQHIAHGHDGAADLYEWGALAAGDTVGWLALAIKADKAVHVYGDFGGTIAIEGSLEDEPVNPITLTDPGGVALTFTGPGLRSVLQPALKIRPNPGVGVANTTVRLLAVRP